MAYNKIDRFLEDEYHKWPMGRNEERTIREILDWILVTLRVRVEDICNATNSFEADTIFTDYEDFDEAMKNIAAAMDKGLRARQARGQRIPHYLEKILDNKSISVQDLCELDGKVAHFFIPIKYKYRKL